MIAQLRGMSGGELVAGYDLGDTARAALRPCRTSPSVTSGGLVTGNVDSSVVRETMLEYLATPRVDARFSDSYLGAAIRDRTGCRPHQVWEAAWALVGDRLVYLDRDGNRRPRTGCSGSRSRVSRWPPIR